jgi:mannose-6-phosphate isomerase-like protein (cupin superfamily)
MERETRPWGTYEVLLDAEICKVKRITVLAGESPSYQYHHKRMEHWIIISGCGEVTLDDEKINIKAGEYIEIPVLAKHTIFNCGEEDLVFIEVQAGTYFGEDDIVRLSDKYGRV